MFARLVLGRVFFILFLAAMSVGCLQSQDGAAAKPGSAEETGITQMTDATSHLAADPIWEEGRRELTEYPENWLFLIKEVKVTRKSIIFARFSLKNLTDKVIVSNRFSLETSAAYGLRLWHRDTSGSFRCFYSNLYVKVNPDRETIRIQPGEEVTLEFQFSSDSLLGFRFYREPAGGIRDWANVSSVVLEPGEYVVDSQLLIDFTVEDDVYTERRVNLLTGNKVWVDVE